MPIIETVKAWGLGKLIALVVFILCIVLWFVGTTLTPSQVLGLIAVLALAIVLD